MPAVYVRLRLRPRVTSRGLVSCGNPEASTMRVIHSRLRASASGAVVISHASHSSEASMPPRASAMSGSMLCSWKMIRGTFSGSLQNGLSS